MLRIKIQIVFSALLLCSLSFMSCNSDMKESAPDIEKEEPLKIAYATINELGFCDYDLNETALTSAGWTKRFDESFSSNFI